MSLLWMKLPIAQNLSTKQTKKHNNLIIRYLTSKITLLPPNYKIDKTKKIHISVEQ